MKRPYISIIVVGRNDGYGIDFDKRIRLFFDSLSVQCDKYHLNCEVILVEWNPPDTRPPLSSILREKYCMALRIITVSPKLHYQIKNSRVINLYEFYAKNVGIRRARGKYVLVTNPDVVFSDELIKYLAAGRLNDKYFYRADRYDFYGSKFLFFQSFLFPLIRLKLRKCQIEGESPRINFWDIVRNRLPNSYVKNISKIIRRDKYLFEISHLHTYASGDFLLTAKKNWEKVRGYPEWFNTTTHLDTYSCHQLQALGIRQKIFMPELSIFHWEHVRPPKSKYYPVNMSRKTINDLKNLNNGRMDPVINGKDWGMAGRKLPEIELNYND